MDTGIISIIQSYQKGQMPPKYYDMDEWADNHRYINEVSGEKWTTSRVEVARGPMKAVTEPGVRTITAMCCTQILKTELLLNTIGFFMDIDPCPILVVQPKDDVVKKFSSVRLTEMLNSTPRLKNKVAKTGQRDSHNTTGHKEFPGGHVTMVSARSPSNLAMLPIRIVLLDEIDKYESNTGEEGDPVDLAEERMSTFSTNSLSIRVCSPTVKGKSRIEESYETSDQRKPYTRCCHCDHWQVMKWACVHWSKDEDGKPMTETALYHCSECGAAWDEAQRQRALKDIKWKSTAEFVCRSCSEKSAPLTWNHNEHDRWDKNGRAKCECGLRSPNHHVGFWVNKLYSPFRPLSEMAQKWVEAQGNIEKLKTFINTQLAETFEETGDRIESTDWLEARCERYEAELPSEVGVITAGIDTQNDRLEMEIIGWGADEESWSLDYIIIPGDPAQPYVWKKLDEELNKPYIRADGRISYIAAAAIDMGGGHTQAVASFCRTRINRRVWPIRGMGGEGRAYPVWPKNPNRTTNTAVPYYNVGVDSAKNVIYGRLLINKEGPGYCHFPIGREAEWFKQLTAEKRVLRYKGSQQFYKWENPQRKRNEAFDCRNYGYAALCGLQSMGWDVNMLVAEKNLIMDSDFDSIRNGSNIEKKPIDSSNRIKRQPNRKNRSSFMDS